MKNKEPIKIGIIGGSGLYNMRDLQEVREIAVHTPFGNPSDKLITGRISGIRCVFLPRHARGHRILPSEINQRANIYALKSLGVEQILSVGAVGSLKEELAPRHFVFPDQLVDETKGRTPTFFGQGIVAHVSWEEPFCHDLSQLLYETSSPMGVPSHLGGTYICMEGPQFSTRAESEYHRKMGYSIIGMTASPEAKLAREAEICYATVALVTDYDAWKEGEEVSVEKVVENLQANINNVQRLILQALPKMIVRSKTCDCGQSMRHAVFTQPGAMNKATYKKLKLLIGNYVKPK
ncbi:MAG: S-methyl-5'-thioadenosine phosphorylase [Elusimicrobia bacterium]|nr:S-methyl-5'-thioadenosine phosphorylase [Elusimicrobiota bacterium]